MSRALIVASPTSLYHLTNFQSMNNKIRGCSFLFKTSKPTFQRIYSCAPTERKMSSQAIIDTSSSSSRPLAKYHLSMWGDYFLTYTSQLTEITTQEKLEHDELKEKIRKILVETPENSTQKLLLIDTIQRLGIVYHFENEIETSIQKIFDAYQQNENIDDNLYVVALRFRLVRQQGHYMSPDVLKQFINHDGKFKETLTNDVQALLSLYEAAHLRMHEEDILEEALTFTTTHLKFMVPNLDNSLKVQVNEALAYPIRKTVSRVGARKYICIYENIEMHNDLLLKFAKLDFNTVQKLHQKELNELSRWWKDLDFANKLPYARDRLVEVYLWVVGIYFAPQYSRARKWLTKVAKLSSIIDDTYDAYATIDELVLLTDAIERWDISALDSLPRYMRPLYLALLDVYNEMEEVLIKEDKLDRVYYAKYEMKKVVRSYFKEAEWFNAGYVPKCEEYIENGIVSSTLLKDGTTSLVGMKEFITKETFEWISNEPLIARASAAICRLLDDNVTHVSEQQRGHVASFVECYMKEYGASEQEAYVKIQKEVTNAWKDINKGFLHSMKAPIFVLERPLNLARISDTFFNGEDGYTHLGSKVKDLITSLFVEPVNV